MRGEQVTLLRLDVHATGFGDSHFTLSGCCVVWMDGQRPGISLYVQLLEKMRQPPLSTSRTPRMEAKVGEEPMDLPLRWALSWSPEFGSEPSGDRAAHWGRSGLCGPGEKMRCPGGIRAFLASVLDSYV